MTIPRFRPASARSATCATRQHFARIRAAIAAIVFVVSSGAVARAGIVADGNVVPTPPVNGQPLTVGDTGVGFLTVDGSTVLASTTAIVGDDATGIGFALVTEHLSTWNTTALTVGRAGIGDLEVSDGGFVNVSYPAGAGNFIVGDTASGIGTVVVNGLGSFLSIGNSTTIGNLGTGLLRIEDNGFVDATNAPTTTGDAFGVGARGRVELANGKLRTGTLTNNGTIIGSGWIRSVGDLQNIGRIAAGLGDVLTLDTALDNSGYVEINGGEIEFTDLVTNMALASEITLRNGVARFRRGVGVTNSMGVIASLEGFNDIFGLVQNSATGRIVVGGDSVVVFHDNVMNSGSLEITAGSEAIYLGSLTMGAGAALSVGLSENDDGLEYGQITVSETATVAGNLSISLIDGFVPSEGDSFLLVSSAAGVTGSLSLTAPPPLPGQLAWDLDVTSNAVVLNVVPPALVGDYNNDNAVNAADYTVWRNSSGQSGFGMAADGDFDGDVDANDYLVWKSHYGEVLGSGTTIGPEVPEPAAVSGVLSLALVLCGWRTRGRWIE